MDELSSRQRHVVKNTSRISFADENLRSVDLHDRADDDRLSNDPSNVTRVYRKEGHKEFQKHSSETTWKDDPPFVPSEMTDSDRLETTLRFPGYVRSASCFVMAVGAAVAFEYAQNDIGLTFQKPLGLIMQAFCFVFLFYALAMYLRSIWTTSNIFAMFSVCAIVEILIGYAIAQDELDTVFVQPMLTFVVLLCVSGVSMFWSLDIIRCAMFITGISITRFLAYAMIIDLPRWLRPVLAYCSGAVGVVAARYTAVVLHSVSSVDLSVLRNKENGNCLKSDRTTGQRRQSNIAARRISLPNLMKKNSILSSIPIDSTSLMKAEGLLVDMIADPALPRHIVRGLRAVKTLLKPYSPNASARRSKSIPHVSLSPSSSSPEQTYFDLPYTDDHINVYSTKNLQRSLSATLGRCRPAGTWTTTTSATGMPSLETELLHRRKFNLCSERGYSGRLDENWIAAATAGEKNDGPVLSDDLSSEDPMLEMLPESLAVGQAGPVFTVNEDQCEDINSSADLEADNVTSKSHRLYDRHHNHHHHITFSDSETSDKHRNATCSHEHMTPDVCEYDSLLDMKLLSQWDYPIFDISTTAPDTILCRVAHKIFKELGFFETFSIPVREFLNYFHALELGYHDNPYHNRIHATDVLHAVFYMTTQSIPGFVQVLPDDDYGILNGELENRHDSNLSGDLCGKDNCMRNNFLQLELMALYTAAAMHDYDHPGRTNAFLVSTCNPLAVLYNNRSVLENHHAASAWRLLLSSPCFAWLANLNNAQFKRFRFLVIDAILATDLARHFELVAEFNAKVNDDDSLGINWTSEADRQMVSNMVIKMADINGPCKIKDLHVLWTERISEEFYEQGDEEERLGLVISPYMNRLQRQLAKLQESFISHLVAPLCNSLSSAGLLPGHQCDTSLAASHDSTFDQQLENGIICPMIRHLEENHQMWVKIIETESVQQQKKSSSGATGNEAHKSNSEVGAEANIPTGDRS